MTCPTITRFSPQGSTPSWTRICNLSLSEFKLASGIVMLRPSGSESESPSVIREEKPEQPRDDEEQSREKAKDRPEVVGEAIVEMTRINSFVVPVVPLKLQC